jgi:epoxyqueuosine reductase QueG
MRERSSNGQGSGQSIGERNGLVAPSDNNSQGSITWVDLVEILESSDEELLDRFGRWYIPGRQARYLRRNALVALGNIGDLTSPRLRQAILNEMANNDEMIREHACWAFDKLSRTWDS